LSSLLLKRASPSRPSGEWNDDGFDVLAHGAVVGRIMKAAAAPVGAPWLWTILSYEDRQPVHGHKVTREAAWRHSPRAGGGSDERGKKTGEVFCANG